MVGPFSKYRNTIRHRVSGFRGGSWEKIHGGVVFEISVRLDLGGDYYP